MESKKDKTIEEMEEFEDGWMIGLILVAALFGNWGQSAKYDELEKRISKLETKNEIFEKILF